MKPQIERDWRVRRAHYLRAAGRLDDVEREGLTQFLRGQRPQARTRPAERRETETEKEIRKWQEANLYIWS